MSESEVGLCTKYFLFFFNVLFWLVSLAALGAGLWAWSEKGFFDKIDEITALPLDPVLLVISIGALMFILSLTGCLGSLRENICLLKFFSTFLGLIFFIELAAGGLGFFYQGWLKAQFAKFIDSTIEQYRDDPDLQNIIDFCQQWLQCCGGINGPNDWDGNIYFNCTGKVEVNGIPFQLAESCGVPYSCCIGNDVSSDVINTQCGYGVRDLSYDVQVKHVYTQGCITKFEDWLKVNLNVVAGVLVGVAVMQIVPICFAQNLISDVGIMKMRQARNNRQ